MKPRQTKKPAPQVEIRKGERWKKKKRAVRLPSFLVPAARLVDLFDIVLSLTCKIPKQVLPQTHAPIFSVFSIFFLFSCATTHFLGLLRGRRISRPRPLRSLQRQRGAPCGDVLRGCPCG